MITVRGKKVTFTGKDRKRMETIAKDLGLNVQTAFTGMLWEHIMRVARWGLFKRNKK